MKNIIVALDDMKTHEAFDLTEKIREYIWGVKLNDLIDREGVGIITEFRVKGIKVFADPKLKDIPNTVKNRIKHYEDAGANFVTVMADGGKEMMMAAKETVKYCKVIGVTVLTSLSSDDCVDIYKRYPTSMVTKFVNDIIYSGLDGVVCSPNELSCLNRPLDIDNRTDYLMAITPGIRPEWYYTKDDQKRTSRPKNAIMNGADFLVIGRPITKAENLIQAAKLTYEEVEKCNHDLHVSNCVNIIEKLQEDKKSFSEILHTCMVFLKINRNDCAKIFDVSCPTVDRWVYGKTEPHVAMKELIYKTLKEKITQLKF